MSRTYHHDKFENATRTERKFDKRIDWAFIDALSLPYEVQQ